MKDNMLVGFSLILCGEFHGISMGAYVKKVSTKSPFELTVVPYHEAFFKYSLQQERQLTLPTLPLQYQTHPFLF
jgi:hypothetical protein